MIGAAGNVSRGNGLQWGIRAGANPEDDRSR